MRKGTTNLTHSVEGTTRWSRTSRWVEEQLEDSVKLRFNCTEFSIRHRAGEAWVTPPIWETMAKAVRGLPFTAVVAHNGSLVSMDATAIHEAVIVEMHQAGALPIEMTTALEVTNPPRLKGIYDSLGAQWNPAGLPTMSGPVVLADPPTACRDASKGESPRDWITNAAELEGSIVLVERGKCTFLEKVELLHELMAVGVIVADTVSEPLLLMGGHVDKKLIPSVMVTQELGSQIKATLEAGEELEVKMLSGVEAMRLKGSVGLLGGDEKKKSNVPDFLGYNSMIEDQIKRRFSMFPSQPVGVGDRWNRQLKVQMNGQKTPTWVQETYEMLEVPEAPPCEKSRWSVHQESCADQTRKGLVVVQMNTTHIKKPTGGGPEPGPGGEIDPTQPDDITVTESGIRTHGERRNPSVYARQGSAHPSLYQRQAPGGGGS
jgi:hypothetical protein